MTQSHKNVSINLRIDLSICLLLVLVTLGVFYQVGTFQFINYDTPTYVYENNYLINQI